MEASTTLRCFVEANYDGDPFRHSQATTKLGDAIADPKVLTLSGVCVSLYEPPHLSM